MRCDDLNRWLDEGAPASNAAAFREHAAECPACARSLAAFEALEQALALPAPAPPNAATFTARVMAQVAQVAEGARIPAGAHATPARVAPPAATRIPARASWWGALLAEPAFAVAFVAALLLATAPAALRMEAGKSVAIPLTVASETLGAQVSQTIHAWLGPFTFAGKLSPTARLYVLLGFAPLFLWTGVWMFGAIERFVRGAHARRG